MLFELDRRHAPVAALPFHAGARIVLLGLGSTGSSNAALAFLSMFTGALPEQWRIHTVVLLADLRDVSLRQSANRKES
jgi:hypothetical protein